MLWKVNYFSHWENLQNKIVRPIYRCAGNFSGANCIYLLIYFVKINLTTFIIISADTTPPFIQFCPSDITNTIEIGTPGIQVFWDEPRAFDSSGNFTLVNATHTSGEIFAVGSSLVRYTFEDESNNMATCEFNIIVLECEYWFGNDIFYDASAITSEMKVISVGPNYVEIFWGKSVWRETLWIIRTIGAPIILLEQARKS